MTIRGITFALALVPASGALGAEFTLEEFRKLHPQVARSRDEDRVFNLHKQSAIFRRYDLNADGLLDPAEVAAMEGSQAHSAEPIGGYTAQDSRSKVKALEASVAPQPDLGQRTTVKTFLRHDFKNVWLFEDPSETFDDAGAELNFSSDRVAHNSVWSLHGVAAVAVQYEIGTPSRGQPRILGYSLAPYVLVDRLENSNPNLKGKNVRTTVFGGSGEIGIQNVLFGDHYFRLRGQANTDDVADVKTGSAIAEWFPVYPSLNIGIARRIPGLPILYTFNPELVLRFDQAIGKDHHLEFVPRDHSARLGPVFRATFKLNDSDFPEFFRRAVGNIAYGWSQDLYSGRRFTWLEPSLTYNLNDEGNFGITASVRKGNKDDTGARTNEYRIGLAAKW